jgi:streptogramin lyase
MEVTPMKAFVALAIALTALAGPAAANPLERPESWTFPSRVAGVYPVGRNPVDLAFAPNGEAWVANMADGTVTRLAPDGRRLGTFRVGDRPRKVLVDAQGKAWVYAWGDNAVRRLSPDGRVEARYAVGRLVNDMAFGPDGSLWLASTDSDQVIHLSPEGRVLATLPLARPISVDVDDRGTVWVAMAIPRGTTNLMAYGDERVEGYSLPGTPQAIEVGPDQRVWATFFDSTGRVSRLSADRRRVDDLWTGFANADVVVDRGHLWVSNSRYDMAGLNVSQWGLENPLSNTVSTLTPGGGVLATYSVGSDAWAVKVSPAGEPWVVNFLAGTVTRLCP